MIVRSLACFALFVGIAHHTLAQEPGVHTRLRIGLIVPGEPDPTSAASAARGVRLGAAEAEQTAALFGDDVELFEAMGTGPQAVVAANRLLSGRQVQVLIASSAADADAVSRFAESHYRLFLNVVSRAQSLREACRRYTFHVEATDRMYSAAGRLKRAAAPSGGATGARAESDQTDSVVLWGSSLERFGASQINQRFRDKYHMEMDGPAWAGWFAVKIASEAALRARSTSPSKLIAYLESATTQFDGHKGWPLSFRRAEHQLRQPLYMALTGTPNGEKPRLRDVPELRANAMANSPDQTSARTTDLMLDALIARPGDKKCSWSGK